MKTKIHSAYRAGKLPEAGCVFLEDTDRIENGFRTLVGADAPVRPAPAAQHFVGRAHVPRRRYGGSPVPVVREADPYRVLQVAR